MIDAVVPLARLDASGEGKGRLWGHYVRVRNAGAVNVPDEENGSVRAMPIGDARPDQRGDFIFEDGRGGPRLDKLELVKPNFRLRYIAASHFGEVNTYFHLDRVAAYVNELLCEVGGPPLPRVTAVVNAHHAATGCDGIRDGVFRHGRWLPFQGGHYRLSDRCTGDVRELEPVSPDGEIHLGPGRGLNEHGALALAACRRYRANASHNGGILYHEYGHHLTRHTADFRANALQAPERQSNRKTAMDEGTCDYLAATMLNTPHIWAWHCLHDDVVVHPRSLASTRTMKDFDASPGADPHFNGTIWAAALWDLRTRLAARYPDGARKTDLLMVKGLLVMGLVYQRRRKVTLGSTRRARAGFGTGLRALLCADAILNDGQNHDAILECFLRRGVEPAPVSEIGSVGSTVEPAGERWGRQDDGISLTGGKS